MMNRKWNTCRNNITFTIFFRIAVSFSVFPLFFGGVAFFLLSALTLLSPVLLGFRFALAAGFFGAA